MRRADPAARIVRIEGHANIMVQDYISAMIGETAVNKKTTLARGSCYMESIGHTVQRFSIRKMTLASGSCFLE